jgi:hypothetical protein
MSVPASAQDNGLTRTPALPEVFAPSERTLPKMLARQAERYAMRRLVAIPLREVRSSNTFSTIAVPGSS